MTTLAAILTVSVMAVASPSYAVVMRDSLAILVYWIWLDQTMCVQCVQNTLPESTAPKDTILLYTTTTTTRPRKTYSNLNSTQVSTKGTIIVTQQKKQN